VQSDTPFPLISHTAIAVALTNVLTVKEASPMHQASKSQKWLKFERKTRAKKQHAGK